MVLFRERYVDINVLTDLSANQLILKARDEAVGTDGQIVVLTFATVECNAVNETFKVQFDHIAVFYSTVIYVYCTGVFLLLFLKLSLDFLICYSKISFLNLYTFVLAQSNFRFHSYCCCKDKRFASFNLYNVDLRIGYDLQLALLSCIAVGHRHYVVSSLFIEYTNTIHFFDHLARCFTFSEARKGDFSFFFQVCSLDSFFKFFSGHFDGQLCHVFF